MRSIDCKPSSLVPAFLLAFGCDFVLTNIFTSPDGVGLCTVRSTGGKGADSTTQWQSCTGPIQKLYCIARTTTK
jgi:hypothetical protein